MRKAKKRVLDGIRTAKNVLDAVIESSEREPIKKSKKSSVKTKK